eukprot:6394699-Prymnesium_polylepis.1
MGFAHGGVVRESDPGFRAKPAKVTPSRLCLWPLPGLAKAAPPESSKYRGRAQRLPRPAPARDIAHRT